MTMEAVATRAEVGKPTVYRWWPDRHAVVMAALMAGPYPGEDPHVGKSAFDSLRNQLRQIATRFTSPTGRHITSMLAAADTESELGKAFRGHFVLARRAEGRAILEQGIADGEVRRDLEIDVALDELYGAVFFRLLLGHAPLDTDFIDTLIDQVMDGIKVRSRARSAMASRPTTR